MKKNNAHIFLTTNGLYLIIAIALIIRMAFFLSYKPWDQDVVDVAIHNYSNSDAPVYNQLALSLLSDKSFYNFNACRTPGYPVFVALIYSISNGSVWLVLFVQILLNLFSVYLVFIIARSIFTEKIAFLSALLFAIDINQAFYNVTLYTETLFVTMFLSSILFLCKALKENTLLSVLISALFLGVATLVRPITFLFPVIAVFSILVLTSLKLKTKLIYSLIFVTTFYIIISPWLIHNYSKFGEAKLSTLPEYNLLFYYAAYTEVYKTGKDIELVRKDFRDLAVKQGVTSPEGHGSATFEDCKVYSRIAKDYIKDNFILYCKRHLMGIVNLYTGMNTKAIAEIFHLKSTNLPHEQFASPGIINSMINFYRSKSTGEVLISFWIGLFLLFNYFFSLFGMLSSLKRKDKYSILFVLIILYFSIITGVEGLERFRLPFMPFINIFCAIGVFHFYFETLPKLKTRKH